jgi:hypothetical protein
MPAVIDTLGFCGSKNSEMKNGMDAIFHPRKGLKSLFLPQAKKDTSGKPGPAAKRRDAPGSL